MHARSDELVEVALLPELVPSWRPCFGQSSDTQSEALPRPGRKGRPWGDDAFMTRLESALERAMRRQKPGPKRSTNASPE